MDIQYAVESREVLKRFSRFQQFQMRVLNRMYLLGKEIPRGWTGLTQIYFMWCEKCERFAKATPHGSTRPRVECMICRAEYPVPDMYPKERWWRRVKPIPKEDITVFPNRFDSQVQKE